jgi:predicted MPP superfamily phosphohydrolase
MRRFTLAVVVLWAAFLFLHLQGQALTHWGMLNEPVQALARVEEVLSFPFAFPAMLLVPSSEQQYRPGHYVLRTGLAALAYVGAVALAGWGRRRAARGTAVSPARSRLLPGEKLAPGLAPAVPPAGPLPGEAPSRALAAAVSPAGPHPLPGETGPEAPSPAPRGLTRRRLLAEGAAGLVSLSVLGTAAYGVLVEPERLQVRRYQVALAGLPEEFEGLRLGHLSDTHFGPLVTREHIARAIALLNAERPDLVLLTGDYVHRTPAAIGPGIGLLATLQARWGALAVLGNHDHWKGAEACRRRFAQIGIPLLDNDRLFLTPEGLAREERPGSLAFCGVGDMWEDIVDPLAALRGVSPGCPRILLSHNPDVAERLPRDFPGVRFDLQISGHTHGGQVDLPFLGPPLVPSYYGAKYAGGLVAGPAWPVLISRGVGLALAPVRLRVPPEVGLIELRRA